MPTLDGNGGVVYGAKDLPVSVHYYWSGSTIFRKQDTATPTPLAVNVQDFTFNITDTGKVVSTRITFNPIFRVSGASAAVTAATAFYNKTMLRNFRTDTLGGVY